MLIKKENKTVKVEKEVYLVWREIFKDPETGEIRMVIPHADPKVYEDAMDWLFETPEQAIKALILMGMYDEAVEEKWILVEETMLPLHTADEFKVEYDGNCPECKTRNYNCHTKGMIECYDCGKEYKIEFGELDTKDIEVVKDPIYKNACIER